MPAPLLADWEPVKATAIALGNLKAAAQAHGVTYDAVRVQASRGNWPVGRRVRLQAAQAKAEAELSVSRANCGAVTAVTSTADALSDTLKSDSQASKVAVARYGRLVLEHAAKKAQTTPAKALADARNVHEAAKSVALAAAWQDGRADSFEVDIRVLSLKVERNSIGQPTVNSEPATE